MRLAVTTPYDPSPEALASAREAAGQRGLPFLERGRRSLAAVARDGGVEALLVLGARAALFAGGAEHPWDPGMGALRVKRLIGGETATADSFLEAARLRPGEVVVDCTLGSGADALVAAAAVGPAGRVVGLESSPALAAWVAEGLRRLPVEAARRVEVVAQDHRAWLDAAPERSADVVVFDPMFRHARAAPPGFDLVRSLADARPLSAEAVDRARRVARRGVLVKDGTPGWDLARLGLAPLPSRRGAHRLYAWLDAAGTGA